MANPSSISLSIANQRDIQFMNNTQFTSILPKINEPGFYTKRNDQSSTLFEFPAVKGSLNNLNTTSGDLNISA
jgi:hypothetical protein